MITIPSLGALALSPVSQNTVDAPSKNGIHRNGSVLEILLGPRDQNSNRGSREGSMGPPSRQSSNASGCSVSSLQDAGNSGSQFFEVLYLGKIKSVSHRKAPPTFIDDVLEKFRAHNQQEEQRVRQSSLPVPGKGSSQTAKSPRQSHLNSETVPSCHELRSMFANRLVDTQEEEESAEYPNALNGQSTLDVLKQTERALKSLAENECQSMNPVGYPLLRDDDRLVNSCGNHTAIPPRYNQTTEPMLRNRASSMGSCNRPQRVSSASTLEVPRQNTASENNRTMLLQIGRCDVKLISPDRKSVLLSKPFCDISHCSQGVHNRDNFGFICRDAAGDSNVCYVFKCQNSSVADEIMAVLRLTSQSAAEFQRRVQGNLCEQCPTLWLQRLMAEVEGLPEQKAHGLLMKRISGLPEADQNELLTKYRGADLIKTKEQNDLLLWLLKAHCEAKQMTHTHDTAESRHEFLSQYFDRGSGDIFKKAKRSLTNSFDQLLKRRSKDDSGNSPPPAGSSQDHTNIANGIEKTPSKQNFLFDMSDGLSQSPLSESSSHRAEGVRRRSSTLCSSHGDTIKKEVKDIQNKRKTSREQEQEAVADNGPSALNVKSPIMDLFFKVGKNSQLQVPVPAVAASERTPSPRRPSASSWRQAIFQQVKTPKQSGSKKEFSCDGQNQGTREPVRVHRSREDYRTLWRMAAKQQILLIRMEKENKRLKAHQEEMAIKRLKLNYDEIAPCPRLLAQQWEKLLLPSSTGSAPDFAALAQAIEKGVSRQRRGEAWRLLVSTRNVVETRQPVWCRGVDYDRGRSLADVDHDRFPLLDVPYEELLGQLTSHQHAIIIDLGRTFPTQKYFQASLGPGQLALYNLLKAYSLLDSEVGYCQGLSFIAGVLLIHLEEKEAYLMLRFLMLELGLRKQYLPDMAALQVQLYQMARLLRDLHRDLYEHLESNEVGPTLYAAPWFLTLFASQFPLGFVVRVFDLIFMSGMSMVFRVALSLLADHKDMLLQCRNFEQLMDYFKTTVPCMGSTQLERVIREALSLDISRKLAEYEVEYHVIQEEIVAGFSPLTVSPTQQQQQQQQPSEDWKDKAQQLEEANQALMKQVRELTAQLQSSKVTNRVLENNLAANQSRTQRLERKLHDYETDRAALVHLVTDLMKQLPIGQEVIIPPDLARCLEEFNTIRKHEDGISIKPNILTDYDRRAQ